MKHVKHIAMIRKAAVDDERAERRTPDRRTRWLIPPQG